MNVADLLKTAAQAVRAQDWHAALQLLEQAEWLDMDIDNRLLFLATRASAYRHTGNLEKARQDYISYDDMLLSDDSRRVESLVGMAECYLIVGATTTALQLAFAAKTLGPATEVLRIRTFTVLARCQARANLNTSLNTWRALFASGMPEGSARANARFYYGETLLLGGQIEDARRQFALAGSEARAADAVKTVADSMRRETTVRVLLGEAHRYNDALGMLTHAARLYSGVNDRSSCMIYTERGEILKQLRVYPRAHMSFKRGLWQAKNMGEQLRVAHNFLGQAEIMRLTATWQLVDEPLLQAENIYQKVGVAWGQFYCLVVRALAASDSQAPDRKARSQESIEFLASAKTQISERDRAYFQQILQSQPYTPLRLAYPD